MNRAMTHEPTLEEILAKLAPCDLVIVEGYKRDGHDKIEVRNLEPRASAACGRRPDRGGDCRQWPDCRMRPCRFSTATT